MKKSYKQYSNRRYLSQDDFPKRQDATVASVIEEIVAPPGGKPKEKLIVFYKEFEKGHVLNQANGLVLERLAKERDPGLQDPENPVRWPGLRVSIGRDPNVMFGPEVTGGIRLWPIIPKPKLPRSRRLKQQKTEPNGESVSDEFVDRLTDKIAG